MKVDTINVVETSDEDYITIRSFINDSDGEIEAHTIFSELLKEKDDNLTQEDIDEYIDEGMYVNDGYQLHLIRSE